MSMKVLTNSEKLLLSSVGIFATSLTLIVIFCVVKKNCWLHKIIWNEDKKKKKHKLEDMICIRYPPDIYPPSIGLYRENIIRSPEDELARLFNSPAKRDSTYSSMSETSNGSTYDLSTSSQRLSGSSSRETSTTNSSSPVANLTTPETPGTLSPESTTPQSGSGIGPTLIQQQLGEASSFSPSTESTGNNDATAAGVDPPNHPEAVSNKENPPPDTNVTNSSNNQRAAAAVAAANQRQSGHPNCNNIRQPLFTFALKYEQDNNLVRIDFIEARNLPLREYVNQPPDVYFTIEIHPKNQATAAKPDAMRYRFMTKTLKKATDVCDFSEKFLAQLSKHSLKNYLIRFSAFDQDKHGNPTELGCTTLTFDDFRDFTLQKLILSCSLQEPIIRRGEIMIGLCYLPTAERMSVTIAKVTNLNPYFSHGTITKQSICYVRLLLMRADTGRVLKKKKTTFQRLTGSSGEHPLFNETLVFDMPPNELIQTVVLAMVCFGNKPRGPKHHRSDAAYSVVHHYHPQQQANLQNNQNGGDDGLFHFSGNLSRGGVGGNNGNTQRTGKEANNNAESRSSTNQQQQGQSNSELPSTENVPKNMKGRKEKDVVVGKVAFGCCVKNPTGRLHWEKMVLNPRNVVNEWHYLK